MTMDGRDVVAFDNANRQWRLKGGASAWIAEGAVPAGDQVSLGSAFSVGGRVVVDSFSRATNGRILGYREASGAWLQLGSGAPTNRDVIVITSSGRLVDTDGVAGARLRPLVDPTVGVAGCRRDQLDVAVDHQSSAVIVRTNRSSQACSVDGQRPHVVEMHAAGSWVSAPTNAYLYPASDGTGGLVRPAGTARVRRFEWLDANSGASCPIAGVVDAVRFSLPSGELVEVPITNAPHCPDLGALTAAP